MASWISTEPREILQENKTLRVIKNIVAKCLAMWTEIVDRKGDHYVKFYGQFGGCLKRGILEYTANRPKIAVLLRFVANRSGDKQISLTEYMTRNIGQENLLHVAEESLGQMAQHFHIILLGQSKLCGQVRRRC